MHRRVTALFSILLAGVILSSAVIAGQGAESEHQPDLADLSALPLVTSSALPVEQPDQPQTGSRQGLFKVGEPAPTRPGQEPATVRPVAFLWECPSPFVIWADNLGGTDGGLQTLEGTLTYQSRSMEITNVAPRQGFALDSTHVDPQQGTITFAASRSQGGVVDGPILEIQAQKTDGASMGNVGPLTLQLEKLVDAGGRTFQPQQVVDGRALVIMGGDVRPQDGQRDVRDALNTLKWSVDTGDVDLSERQRARADVVPDGVINILDALNTLKTAVIDNFDPCQATTSSAGINRLEEDSAGHRRPGGLTFEVSDRRLAPGQAITLRVQPDSDLALRALQGTVTFDPRVIEVRHVEPQAGELAHTTVDSEAGEVRFGVASLRPIDAGDGLVRIKARIQSRGDLPSGSGGETERLTETRVGLKPTVAQGPAGTSSVPSSQRVRLTIEPQVRLRINDIRTAATPKDVTFHVQGQGIDAIRAQVFDLTGREVYATPGWVANGHQWDQRTETGRPIANGVYLYVVTVRGVNGTVRQGPVQKMVQLR